ncbi:Brain tumor proteinlike, partial [Caligus rogercresseyi]
RLMKYSNNAEVMCFKRPLEQKFSNLINAAPDLTMDSVCDIEYVTNFQAIQSGVSNSYGFVRSRHDPHAVVGGSKQPPISRPFGGTNLLLIRPLNAHYAKQQHVFKQLDQLPGSEYCKYGTQWKPLYQWNDAQLITKCFVNLFLQLQQWRRQLMLERRNNNFAQGGPACFENNGCLLTKRFVSPLGPLVGNALVDLAHPTYDKCNNNKLLFSSTNGSNNPGGGSIILDLSNKLLSASSSSSFPQSLSSSAKMIYHCKFGEFGPSGVAVNAQNDIIVADTNNHRIQIFDKEGRFKFQFGECGKRDGQLLYPNRVAVVRASGDIIVTERSPTHQVQIYNQYGQFVRKFGANILQHPRGVCVDNVGRIIVVECKVMRHLEFPNGVVVNDRQEIFISDNRAHCVKVFNYEGAYLRQIGGE